MSVFDENIITEDYLVARGFEKDIIFTSCATVVYRIIVNVSSNSTRHINFTYFPFKSKGYKKSNTLFVRIYKYNESAGSGKFYHIDFTHENILDQIELESLISKYINESI